MKTQTIQMHIRYGVQKFIFAGCNVSMDFKMD